MTFENNQRFETQQYGEDVISEFTRANYNQIGSTLYKVTNKIKTHKLALHDSLMSSNSPSREE